MRKVLPEDIIPVRTDEEVKQLENTDFEATGTKALNKELERFNRLGRSASHNTTKKAPLIMKSAYKIADLAHELNAKNSICSKGCAYCCKVPVDVSALEAHYIEHMTGFKIVKHNHVRTDKLEAETYCPFLDHETATCSIHPFRPIACRTFHAFDDHKYCVGNDQTHAISSANSNPITAELVKIIDNATPDNKAHDIRYWFGEDSLSPHKNG